MTTRILKVLGLGLAFALPAAACGGSPAAGGPPPAAPTAAAPAGASAPAQAASTAKAPAVTFTDLEGKTFTVADLAGDVKVINFWATWCAPCIKEIPSFNALNDKYAAKNVTFVGVSVDENGKDDVAPFLATPKGKIGYRVALAKLADLKPIDVTESIPVTLIYDKAGTLVKRLDGFHEQAEIESAIQAALGSAGA